MAEGSPSEIIVRRFFEEVWNERKLDLVDEIIDPNCVTHQLRSGAKTGGVPCGPDAIKAHIQQWLGGFPDLKFTIKQIFSDQDKVFLSIDYGGHAHRPLGANSANAETDQHPDDDRPSDSERKNLLRGILPNEKILFRFESRDRRTIFAFRIPRVTVGK